MDCQTLQFELQLMNFNEHLIGGNNATNTNTFDNAYQGDVSVQHTTMDSRRERRCHSTEEWENIKPIFTRMYVDDEMTLQNVMDKLKWKYGFNATVNMYKKHIKAWGISKNFTARDKDAAILDLLKSTPQAIRQSTSDETVQKILRHARARMKKGTLDKAVFDRLAEQERQLRYLDIGVYGQCLPNLASERAKVYGTTVHPVPNLMPPTDLLNSEKFFLSLSALISASQKGNLADRNFSLVHMLNSGCSFWACNAFSHARAAFQEAANMIMSNFEAGSLPDISLIVFLNLQGSAAPTSVIRRLFYFIADITCRYFGPNHPLFAVIQLLQLLPADTSRDIEERALEYTMNTYQLTPTNSAEWVFIGKRRSWILTSCGMHELAEECYHRTTKVLQHAGLLHEGHAVSLMYELADIHIHNKRFELAIQTLQDIVKISSKDFDAHGYQVVTAYNRLALIYASECDNIAIAKIHYVEAFRSALIYWGPENYRTLDTLIYMLAFFGKHQLCLDDVITLEEFIDSYNYLEEITEGFWYVYYMEGDETDTEDILVNA